ncbi:DUF4190 domain-containing protein [Catalinimonas alkaloidigena]|uniref:DUF4190 domain-containing protein n=1 Tax=Catalinimonas alkaloidigena TaxID=1075417 RepID=UPI001160020C|nr:DUF4190 domain-containing protein [Catalinimonas alkaloidigena]
MAGLFVPLTWALLSVVPFIGLLSLGSVVMAIVFGIIGMRRTRREGRRGYGLALAGLIMGLVWTLVGILGIVLIILLILAWQG